MFSLLIYIFGYISTIQTLKKKIKEERIKRTVNMLGRTWKPKAKENQACVEYGFDYCCCGSNIVEKTWKNGI